MKDMKPPHGSHDDAASNAAVPRAPHVSSPAHPAGGAAHKTPQLHRRLVDSVRDYAIFALDRTGHVLTWNAGAHRFKGWAAEEIIGRHFSTFYLPEDVASGRPERLLHRAEHEGSAEDEGWRQRKDGSRFWANVIITALYDETGALVGFAKVTRDLTEKRAAEEELRRSEERFRLLVQSVQDYAIFMLDPDGNVATWNEGASRIKGYTAQEIVGRHFSVFYPLDRVAEAFPQYELRMAKRDGRFEDEGWRVRKDGSQFWASVVITALHHDSELVGFAKVTRDLTERKRAQEQAVADARRVAEMQAASRAKSEFLTTLSHELRTPLNAIAGYTDLISAEVAGPVHETYLQYLARIKTSQQHLLALINDLLYLSRVEAAQIEYQIGPVPMRELLNDLEAMILPQAQARRLTFIVDECGPDAIAFADTARTQQILLNLLANAVKFTPEGGRISMVCTATHGQVVVRVIDTGPGIDEEHQEAIFQPFVQVGRSITNVRDGIGLGLAISRDLARGMSGELSVTSRAGAGSTFTLVLPRDRVRTAPP
jgi:PAS domain S-box-containing protein